MAADELEEARKLAVAGRFGDRAVEGEVLVDRRASSMRRLLDSLQRIGNCADLRLRRPLRRESGGFDLHAEAQLHHVEDLVKRLQSLGLDAKRRALRLGRHESADALARDDEPFGA